MKGRSANNRTAAFTLIELLMIIAVLVLLAGLLLPASSGNGERRRWASRINCVNNLKQVSLSFHLWASDHNDKYPMQVTVTNGGTMEAASSGIVFSTFQLMSNELSTPKILVCPADTKRIVATKFTTDFNNSKVSYFVGLDAEATKPDMLLAGDRNITNGTSLRNGILMLTTNTPAGWMHEIHRQQGNLALADGSVQQVTTSKLREALKYSGTTTNRLALP